MLANRRVYLDYYKAFTHQCDEFLKRKDVLEELRAEKFDIIISEQLHLCGTGLKHVLDIPTHILVNSCPVMEHIAWIMGIPLAQSYVPAVADVDVSDTMSYYERVQNLIESVGTLYIYMDMTAGVTRTYRKHFGPQFPDVADIVRESPLVFVSVDELVDFPRPTLHNVVYIGGLGMSIESHALPEPYKSEMEKGKNGVVFFSFGSNTNTNQMPEKFKQNLFTAFSKLRDYHFIIKIDKGDTSSEALAANTSNAFITNWAPQTDLLAHPRMKAFITHGGYNSLLETARLGVPIIAMPFFVDQFRNARVAERNGWGISFEKTKLLHGHEEFLEALRRILEDPRVDENAKRTKHLLATKPFSAEERLVKYTQFVADNGGQLPELQIQGCRLSFIVYHNLDIYIPLVVISLALLYWTARLLLLVVRWVLRPFAARKLKTD
ncbi:CRE-UGT-49 protein [Aphelenchoides avenae]|nr:CRE-UGT-49 protein [Aphelenchus avenae]